MATNVTNQVISKCGAFGRRVFSKAGLNDRKVPMAKAMCALIAHGSNNSE